MNHPIKSPHSTVLCRSANELIGGFMWRHIEQILQVIVLTTAMLVSCLHGMVLGKCSKTSYLVHTTLSNYNRVTRISAHTLSWNFKSLHKVNRKFRGFLLFSSIPHCTKGKQEMLQNHLHVCAYYIVQTLYWMLKWFPPLLPTLIYMNESLKTILKV